MSSVTIEDVVKLILPPGTRVVAGRQGVSRKVSWACTMSTRHPAFPDLQGGELALIPVALIRLVNEDYTLARIIRDLKDPAIECAGLAVLGKITPEDLQVANEVGMPLISLPPSSDLGAIEEDICRLVSDRNSELDRQASDINRALLHMNAQDEGIARIIERLMELSGKSVVVEDELYRIQQAALVPDVELDLDSLQVALQSEKILASWLEDYDFDNVSPPVLKGPLLHAGLARFVAPIVIKRELAGYLSLLSSENKLESLDRLVVSQSSVVVALELKNRKAVEETESRYQGDFLDDLMSGNFANEAQILARARRLEYDPSTPQLVLLLEADPPLGSGELDGSRQRHLTNRVREEVVRIQPKAFIHGKEQRVTVLFPFSPEEGFLVAQKQLELARQRASVGLRGQTLSAGLGRPYPGVSGLRRAHREAEQALKIGRQLFGPNRLTPFADLGIYRLLFRLHGTEEFSIFYREMLENLLDYDQKSEGDYVRTLEEFFTCHGNLSQTSKALHLHRNSLLYRLERIQQLTGIDLNDAEQLLCLQIALKMHRTMPGDSDKQNGSK